MSLGLYTDLSAEVNRLLRKFDVEWHDPALSRKQLAEFRKRHGASGHPETPHFLNLGHRAPLWECYGIEPGSRAPKLEGRERESASLVKNFT